MDVVDPPLKKARFDEEVNRVAEIVLVLSALRKIRGGKNPTELELELMVEAKSKLVEMCQEFNPKDLIGRDAIGAVIEDLGLNCKVKDQRLGFRAPKLTISEKLSLGKRKMEELKKHPVVSTSYTSPMNNVSMGQHQWPNSEMKVSATASAVNASGGHFVSGMTQARPMFKPDMHTGGSQGSAVPTGNYFGNATPWSGHPHSSPSTISFGTPSESKVHVQSSSRVTDPNFRPFMSQSPQGTFPGMKGVNYGQASSSFGNNNHHAEIAKIIQKVLQPRLKQNLLWNPPSREYMSKAIICQMCQGTVNEVETVLLCDACEKGYHLKCLQANNLKGVPKSEWHCPRCVQLYNGKPFPPKYGRVMRSATTAKMSSSSGDVQLPAEKKVGKTDPKVFNQEPVSHSENAKATEEDTAMSQTVEAKDAAALKQAVEAEDAAAIGETLEAEDAAAISETVEAEDAAMSQAVDDTNNESQDPLGNDTETQERSEPISHSETHNSPKQENIEDPNKDVTEGSVSVDCQDENSKIIEEPSLQEENSASQTENSASQPPPSQSNTISDKDHSQQENATPDVQEDIQKNVTENPEEDKS
ncbi:hypothetical protein AALP_AA4G053600 [Arabis alpina]|uniref:PHD-type domain-containing protein n=1 Tax=Arabis alpina TaxID=50452 RepID=A0A087H1B9_ARAAL|nr:hypothetical protein AALP_AA4G053600 [Arabis alpina]